MLSLPLTSKVLTRSGSGHFTVGTATMQGWEKGTKVFLAMFIMLQSGPSLPRIFISLRSINIHLVNLGVKPFHRRLKQPRLVHVHILTFEQIKFLLYFSMCNRDVK